ncbi:MAG: hypothetical protein AB1668_03460 [Nanoarchaeota archaeon]
MSNPLEVLATPEAAQEPNVILADFGRNILSGFIGRCNEVGRIETIALYIASGTPATSKEMPEVQCLPFYLYCQGKNSSRIVLVERVPEYLTSIPYSIDDREFRTPVRFLNINPREMFCEHARKSVTYIAQQGYDAFAYLRFHPQGELEILAQQTPQRANRLPRQSEPFFLIA